MKHEDFIIIIAIFFVGLIYALGLTTGISVQKYKDEIESKSEQVELITESQDGSLSDWDILQLAIMKTESNFDPTQVGKTKDFGINQITPIFVAEANRIIGENRYTHQDAFDIQKSIEMFNIIQNKHNKTHSIDKAINLHNPGGASIGYSKKVYDNMMFIKRLETAREELIKYNNNEKL